MIATWYVEAGKYNVLPIDSRGTLRIADPRPQIAATARSYTYYPQTQGDTDERRAQILNRPHSHHGRRRNPQGRRGRRAALGTATCRAASRSS